MIDVGAEADWAMVLVRYPSAGAAGGIGMGEGAPTCGTAALKSDAN